MKKLGKFTKIFLVAVICFSMIFQTGFVFAENSKMNVALMGKVTASKVETDYYGTDKLNDGIVNRGIANKKDQSRWSSGKGAPQWAMINLQRMCSFDEINIYWEKGNVQEFHIDISEDGENWTRLYTSTSETGGHPQDTKIDLGHRVYTQYVKVTCDKLISGAYPSVSMYEIEIMGDREENTTGNLLRVNHALGCKATAKAAPISYWGPDKMVDGIINRSAPKSDQSRWSSEAGAPQWVMFDLGTPKSFDEIQIAWEQEWIKNFHIDVSNDGTNFETVYTAETKVEGHPIDTFVNFSTPIQYRYVKLIVDSLKPNVYPSVSIYEVKIIGTKNMQNIAPEASASGESESGSVDAKYINDDNLATRWGSSYGTDTAKTVTLTFDEVKTIKSFILEWERKNAIEYKIDAYVNGEWQTIVNKTKPTKTYQEIFNLENEIQTDKVRLIINSFSSVGTDRDGKTVDYPTVSLHEWIVYSENYPLAPRDPATTVQDIANEVLVNQLTKDDKVLEMPTIPVGYSIEFVGADYEQVITRDLKIIQPVVDTEVVVNFEVVEEETGEKAFTPDIKLIVPGKLDLNESENAKPAVLPALQQWFGKTGVFEVTDSTKIVVDPSAKDFMKAAEALATDYEDIMGKKLQVVTETTPQAGDFYFTLANEDLEKETYYLDIQDVCTIKADQYAGSYWGTRSILQILKQTEGTINKGIAKDYPKYKIRGMMLDVARLPIDMYFLETIVKTMSWYKMNDFQVHLNDNVFSVGEDGNPLYSGFRLESEVPNLTNTDVYYSKNEFRDFINNSKELGVNIVPEFDSPGHSGAFTRAWPELARNGGSSYLDLDNHFDEILEKIKSVFAEYTTGDNPVYPGGTVVHVGTDEYKKGNKENFRKYQDALLKYVRDELGYTPRVWGSQTENNGTTPITVEGVQMNMWYSGYAKPKDMYELGYQMINTNDGDQYIVPGAGYYWDYLSKSHIYNSWQPNIIAGFKVPAGDEQMLGANFCVWNDKTGPVLDNGTTDVELFDRIYHIMPVYGTKLWGKTSDYNVNTIDNLSKKTGYAPNSNPTYQVETKSDTYVDYNFNTDQGIDHSENEYNLTKQTNVDYVDGIHYDSLKLNGDKSYVETPLTDIGLNTTIDFWVNKDVTGYDEEQILFESELGAIKAVQKDTGKFGYTRWHRDYSFDYQLPENEWVHLTIKTQFTKTYLYANGELVSTLERTEEHGNKWASLITPIERIGSETHAFKGLVDDVVITKTGAEVSDTRLLKQAVELAKASLANENLYTKESIDNLKDVVIEAEALLDNEASIDEINQMIENINNAIGALEEKPEVVETDKLALQIAIEIAQNADLENVVPAVVKEFNEALANAKDVFDNAGATQDEVDNAFTRLANVMQMLEFYQGDKAALQKMADQIADLTASDYIESTWNAMLPALNKANDVLDNENAMQEEVDEVYTQLVKAFLDLRLKPNKDLLNDLINKANGLKEANYTAGSWKVMNEALNEAKAVLDDPEATKQEVANAKSALTKAMAGLVEKPAADNNINTVKSGDTTASIKTGDEISLGMLMSLAGLSVLGIVYSKKKREYI